ncbi:MAG: hypothetical protein K0S58_2600 [Nitrospira sp.]|jgi:hypothetical protein|nr:hypothetical protein [Nitrospira sp.]
MALRLLLARQRLLLVLRPLSHPGHSIVSREWEMVDWAGSRHLYRRLDLRTSSSHHKRAVLLQCDLNWLHHGLGVDARVLQARVVQHAWDQSQVSSPIH